MRLVLITISLFAQFTFAQTSGYGVDDDSIASDVSSSLLCANTKRLSSAEIIKKCNAKPSNTDKLECFQIQSVCAGQGRKCNGLTGDSGVQCYFDTFNGAQNVRAAEASEANDAGK